MACFAVGLLFTQFAYYLVRKTRKTVILRQQQFFFFFFYWQRGCNKNLHFEQGTGVADGEWLISDTQYPGPELEWLPGDSWEEGQEPHSP